MLSPHTVIDWAAPWLAPYQGSGASVERHWRGGLALAEALNMPCGAPVRFVPQQQLPPGEAYEAFIARTAQVPTRDNWHDFFNGLCWLHWPKTKQKLNQLHAMQIAQHGVAAVRGAVRDGLTLFDENAAVLHGPDALWQALVAKDWPHLFITLRPLWADATLLLFGHALLEKLMLPRKSITAHVYRAQAAAHCIADIDAWLADDLRAPTLAAKPFAPLPVLGVPQWWPPNADAAFYADPRVFRPPRVTLADPGLK